MTGQGATTSVLAGDGGMAQILVELGKISTQIAVMDERVKAIPDHESRIRLLEAAHLKLLGGSLALSVVAGGGAGWIALLLARGH